MKVSMLINYRLNQKQNTFHQKALDRTPMYWK